MAIKVTIDDNFNNPKVRVLMLKGEKGDLNYNDIVDNLNSTLSNKVLSAKQGKVLKDITDKKPYYFNNVASMKSASLVEGDYAITKGYYSNEIGGSGEYEIVNDNTLNDNGGSIINLDNGLKAKLIVKSFVTPELFGAYGDSDHDALIGHDDTTALQNMINSGYEIFSLRNCVYKITEPILIPRFTNRKMVLKGEIAYRGNDYAIKFTGRVAEATIEFGNIFAGYGSGCIKFTPNSSGTNAIVTMHLSANILYTSGTGNCIFVENDGWFNENFIENINFQSGEYAIKIVNKENSATDIDLGHLVFNNCHFEGIKNGLYIKADNLPNKYPSDIVFNDCRMVEAITGYFCNIIAYDSIEAPNLSTVVINNDIYSREKLTGNCMYLISNGYSFDGNPGFRSKNLKEKRIYQGMLLNPPIADPGDSVTNISTDPYNRTVVDLTTNIKMKQLRSTDADCYLKFNVPEFTFPTFVEIPVTGWPNSNYHIYIQTRSYNFYLNFLFSNDGEVKTLYIDYYNNKVWYY